MVQGRWWRDGGVVLNAGADRVARGDRCVVAWLWLFGFSSLVSIVWF